VTKITHDYTLHRSAYTFSSADIVRLIDDYIITVMKD